MLQWLRGLAAIAEDSSSPPRIHIMQIVTARNPRGRGPHTSSDLCHHSYSDAHTPPQHTHKMLNCQKSSPTSKQGPLTSGPPMVSLSEFSQVFIQLAFWWVTKRGGLLFSAALISVSLHERKISNAF